MGKDATNTFFAENQAVAEQRDNSGLKGEPFKGEQFNSSDSTQFKNEQFNESSKGDFNALQDRHRTHHGQDIGISREMQAGNGLELRKPAGGLHGDKWQDVHDGGQFKGAPHSAQLMDVPAGGMHGDRWRDQQLALGDQFRGETILRPQGEQSSLPPTSTFKALEGASLMEDHFKTTELKSNSLNSGLPSEHGTTKFHDGRFRDGRDEPALHENQILQPALHASKLEDNTMRDATIHGGHSRPLVPESSSLDQLPLAERVVAGVHAGDPLSSATLKKSSVEKLKAKKDKKFKKDKKDKKLERSAVAEDAHLRNDDALIPHDHLKKDQPMLSDQHLGGAVPVLQKQERFDERLASEPIILKKDEQLTSRAPLVQTFIAAGENHIVQEEGTLKQTSWKKDKKKDKKLKKDKHFTNDTHLNKDSNLVDSNAFNRDVNFHDGRDSTAFAKDSQLLKSGDLNKDAHLSRQDAFLVTEDHSKTGSGKKGGKLKDKLHNKKEKLKAKLGMKKEEDLALADSHAHAETHAPKGHEIATIKIPGIESGDRAAQEMVNHQAKAKKELNAELKEHAGHSDHLAPSEISGLGHGMEKMQLNENRALDSQPLVSNINADQITRNQVQAKSELNAEIKSHAGELGSFAQPSQNFAQDLQFGTDNQFARDTQFARDSQQDSFNKSSDALEKDIVLAKNEVNAEIKKAAGHGFFGATDHIQPSDIAHAKPGFTETIKEKAVALKDQLQPMPAATLESRQLDAERLAGVAGTDDLLMKDNMMAKKDINAEIKKAAGHGFFGATDHIQPSDVAPKPILRDAKHFEGEELAGLSGFEDRANILAKKEVNAEIKKAAGHGIFGATDHIQPSDVAPKPGFTDMIRNAALAVKDQFFQSPAKADVRQLEAERLAGLGEVSDSLTKDNMLAKKGVNAEIKAAAGPAIFGAKDHIMPSKVASGYPHREVKHFEGEQLAGLSGNEDVLSLQSKKDVNAEIAKAGQGIFGAKDHIMPSKVSSGYPHRDTKHFEGEQLANLSGNEDSQCLMAKKDVNAEIKKAAGHGFFGATDHIQPSAIAPKHIPKHIEGEQLAGLSGFEDSQSIAAKKSINAEIKNAGHGFFGTHDIHPSDVAPKHVSQKVEGEQLAGLDAANDLLMQDNMLAKKGVNAEIKKTAGHGIFGTPDHILPSDVGKPTLGESIKEKAIIAKDQANIAAVAVKDKANIAAAIAMDKANVAATAAKDKAIVVKDQALAVKEQYKPSTATIDARNLDAQRLAGFNAEDSLAKENVLAKKDVNAEIKQVAGTGLFASDHIMPSDVIHSQQGLGERIKDRAVSAATAVKGQFQSASPLEGEKLAGLSETNDALMKENILAKKEVNAEIRAFGSDNIHPSEIAPAPGGVTVIHDGRSDHLGSDRLRSEMEYEQAQGTAVQGHHLPSVTALLKGTVATAASVAMAAASAMKGQFQAASSREVSEKDFPSEFQKEDFQKELGVGAVKESDMNDDIMRDSILAKKDLNAEIKEHAPAIGDSILPSDISAPMTDAAHPSMTEMIKERVSNVASTVKETLHNLH